MKYVQPYGISDPNASYINGNPSTGTRGSIPPAAGIEHPQREIVNFLNDTGGIAPADTDLHQLAKAVQAGGVNYADDVGTANQLVINLTPAPPALRKGLHVFTTVAFDNYVGGPTTLNLNSLGPKLIKHLDHSDLNEAELKAQTLALFVYDGTYWQWMSAPFANVVTGTLSGNLDYYVNWTTGNDSNNGLTAGSPFKHIQHAIDLSKSFNMNNYNITIHVANGTYDERLWLWPLSGNGSVFVIGNVGSPASCTINPSSTGGVCIHWGSIFPTQGYEFSGFKLTSTSTDGNGYAGEGIYGGFGANRFTDMEFGACQSAHVHITSSCKITMGGPSTKWNISGSAPYHFLVGGQCEVLNYQPTMLISGTPNFSAAFIVAEGLSYVGARWTSITGSATGTRYLITQNSIVNTGGLGASYLPGNVGGSVSSGGQYL